MYLSIQFLLVKKAANFFSKDLSRDEKATISKCLKLIQFGMSNTLVTFVDKYYEYGGDIDGEKRGLTIGGFESAWLADLVAAYILSETSDLFEQTIYHGIYRDDGFMVFDSPRSKREINEWLKMFQKKVDELAECDCLQFTAEVWGIKDDEKIINENLTIINDKVFPYLDMEMYWTDRGDLNFQIHMKPNQKLKYLNSDSTHLPSTLRAIPAGVLDRLSKLTSKSKKLENVRIDKVYPKHAAALKIAGIAPDIFPTFSELENLRGKKTKEEKEIEKKEKRLRRKRESFFCIGVSPCSLRTPKHPPMHVIIKKLRDKYELKWLRVNMSYHKFPNLAQAFMGDLTAKLTNGVKSRDFEDEPCNCTARSKVNGVCMFGGECRKSIVIYKAECQKCKMCYIGNTQTKVKLRTNLHLGEVCTLVNKGKKSDSFARHFASHHINRQTKLTTGEARKDMKVTILWQGKAISSNKTFGTLNCALCMKERLEILKFSKKTPHLLINSSTEFYGACRHKPRFHRYLTTNCTKIHSTDDEQESLERVTNRDSIDSQNSQNSTYTNCSTNPNTDDVPELCMPCTSTERENLNVLASQRDSVFVDV